MVILILFFVLMGLLLVFHFISKIDEKSIDMGEYELYLNGDDPYLKQKFESVYESRKNDTYIINQNRSDVNVDK